MTSWQKATSLEGKGDGLKRKDIKIKLEINKLKMKTGHHNQGSNSMQFSTHTLDRENGNSPQTGATEYEGVGTRMHLVLRISKMES